MPQRLSLWAEVPSTLGTAERFLPTEVSGMFCEFAMFSEALPTLPTGEPSLLTMHTPVDNLQVSQAEALVALWTRKGFFSCVCPAEDGLIRP